MCFITFKIAVRYPKTTFWTLTIYFFAINAKPLVIFTVRLCPLLSRGFLATTSYKEIVSNKSQVDNFFFREGLSLSLASTLVPDKNFSIGPVTEREGELGIAAELQCGSTTVLGIEVTSFLAVLISPVTHTA
jgi:hypothetical protein